MASESCWSTTDLDADRERIVIQIYRCADIPPPESYELCYRLAKQSFSWYSAAGRIQDLALDVSRASHYSENQEVREIKESLYHLAERVNRLE